MPKITLYFIERTKPLKLSYGYRDFIFLKDVRRKM